MKEWLEAGSAQGARVGPLQGAEATESQQRVWVEDAASLESMARFAELASVTSRGGA